MALYLCFNTIFNDITNLFLSALLTPRPLQVIDHGRVAPTLEAFQCHVGNMLGWLRLASKDPSAAPLIQLNYLDTEQDRYLPIYPPPPLTQVGDEAMCSPEQGNLQPASLRPVPRSRPGSWLKRPDRRPAGRLREGQERLCVPPNLYPPVRTAEYCLLCSLAVLSINRGKTANDPVYRTTHC